MKPAAGCEWVCIPGVQSGEEPQAAHWSEVILWGRRGHTVSSWCLAVLVLGHNMPMCRRENELRRLHAQGHLAGVLDVELLFGSYLVPISVSGEASLS